MMRKFSRETRHRRKTAMRQMQARCSLEIMVVLGGVIRQEISAAGGDPDTVIDKGAWETLTEHSWIYNW